MGIRWANSADEHGIDHDDALHALGNAYYVEEEFDEPRVPGHAKPTLFIGPPRTLGGPLLEVMVEMIPPRDLVVFHVMEARQNISTGWTTEHAVHGSTLHVPSSTDQR